MKNIFILITLVLFLAAGCATAPGPHPGSVVKTVPLQKPYADGLYHTVLKGQTLWRIAKAYHVELEELVRANRISDPTKITAGQMIFIPGARDSIRGDLKVALPVNMEMYIWPIKGRIISRFGDKNSNISNKGIDIAAYEGQVVVAARSGKVVFCDDKVKGIGKAIIIDHGDGYSTLYAHNSVNLVDCGDFVKQNQPIAKAGKTGRATRPVLHFEIRKGHKPQNPFYYLS